MAGGLSFESLAEMPQSVRQKAAPLLENIQRKRVADIIRQQEKEASELVFNGIPFASVAARDRFIKLEAAEQVGTIFDLRIHHRIVLEGDYYASSGQRVAAARFVADFTYKTEDSDTAPVMLEVMEDRKVSLTVICRLRELGYTVWEV